MKMKANVLVIALILCIGFTVNARELTQQEKKILEDDTKQHLKDPDSARFTWQDYKGGITYCFYVNAKNSYGGYAGNALVISTVLTKEDGKIFSGSTSINTDNKRDLVAPICTEAGYHP